MDSESSEQRKTCLQARFGQLLQNILMHTHLLKKGGKTKKHKKHKCSKTKKRLLSTEATDSSHKRQAWKPRVVAVEGYRGVGGRQQLLVRRVWFCPFWTAVFRSPAKSDSLLVGQMAPLNTNSSKTLKTPSEGRHAHSKKGVMFEQATAKARTPKPEERYNLA